jgi:hypothetical protein
MGGFRRMDAGYNNELKEELTLGCKKKPFFLR